MNTNEKMLTTKEVAKRVKLTTARIRQLLDDRVIDGFKPQGARDWWIPESQLIVIKARADKRRKEHKK